MTETQERFLRTILTRVDPGTVAELHLFPPIRRGTLETGVAVIATELPPAPLAVVPDGDEPPEVVAVTDDAVGIALEASDAAMVAAAAGESEPVAAADAGEEGSEAPADADATDAAVELTHDAGAAAPVVAALSDSEVDGHDEARADADMEAEPDGSPYRDEPAPTLVSADEFDAMSAGDESVADDEGVEPATQGAVEPPRRLRILTASYRHTIKGAERGKWAVEIQVEADAPADAIEAVLRGVRHRSTEPADPELIGADALAHLCPEPAVAPAA